MNELDFKLKLWAGEPITVEGFGDIRPLKIREIIRFGYSNYLRCLNFITIELKDLINGDVDDEDLKDVNILDILITLGGDDLTKQLEESLSLFLDGEAIVDKENLLVLIKKEKEILQVDRTNYNQITEIIKWQNYINQFEDKNLDNFNPADEKARKLKERFEKLNKKREELKKKKNSEDDENQDIDFYDILTAVASKSYSINEFNILDLTIYQFYVKFKRLDIIDQYNISIKSLLAGAKDIKLNHWSSKIK
jgi:hypothetical protein